MNYSYVGGKERSIKETMFFKEEKGLGHEIVEVSIKATGKKSKEILEVCEKVAEELFRETKEMLERGDSSEPPQ